MWFRLVATWIVFCGLLVLVFGCWFVLVVWLIVLVSCYVLHFMLWWFGIYFSLGCAV